MNTFMTIEPCEEGWNVYEYGEYEDSSVLAGQTRKAFIDFFLTKEEAIKAYPDAELNGGYEVRNNVDHLPDENGHTYTREGYDL